MEKVNLVCQCLLLHTAGIYTATTVSRTHGCMIRRPEVDSFITVAGTRASAGTEPATPDVNLGP